MTMMAINQAGKQKLYIYSASFCGQVQYLVLAHTWCSGKDLVVGGIVWRFYCSVSSAVERLVYTENVGGSIPSLSTGP